MIAYLGAVATVAVFFAVVVAIFLVALAVGELVLGALRLAGALLAAHRRGLERVREYERRAA